MTDNRRDIVAKLAQHAASGKELAALDLHVLGLVAASEAEVDESASALIAAQAWESDHGYARAALHTSHSLALLTNFGGDLVKLDQYYQETLRTLKKLRNREGLALCLRTVGELALLRGRRAETMKAWELSQRLFEALQLVESEQIAAWVEIGSDL